jgi:hypothetical protein
MAIGPLMMRELERYGLASLAPWLSEMIITGVSPEEFEFQLFERQEFKDRFPAIELRRLAGLPPISVEEYLAYENTIQNLSTMWDIPVSKEEINSLLSLNVSAQEVEERFGLAVGLVFESPEEDVQQFKQFYGASEGQIAKYFMDPQKQLGAMQQQYIASRVAGSAIRSGFGPITREQAERLGSLGITPEAASQGFGELYHMRELFNPINQIEDVITREEQLEAMGGNAEIQEEIQTRQATRVAEFGGGGEFAAGGEGFKGAGSAES